MKKVILSVIAVLLLSLLLFTCTEESNPIDNNTPVIDPITNTWTVQSDSNYTIFFRTFDSTATKGVFWGAENHPTIGSTDLCGFFDDDCHPFHMVYFLPLNRKTAITPSTAVTRTVASPSVS